MALYANLYGPEGLEYPNGAHARNVPILVKNPNGSTATLYTDRDRSGFAPNPIYTDSLGNLAFWAEPGDYLLDAPGSNADIPVTVMKNPAEPTGGGGVDEVFVHTQSTPSASWAISHNKGRVPLLSVYVDGKLVIPDAESTVTTTSIVFPSPTSGLAILL